MLESVADMGIVFNTEFNNKLNCRGDGKLYLLYEAASVFPDAVESQSPNGQILPARIIPISETEFVAVLADFGVDQSLSFFSGDNVIYQRRINPGKFSIESKVNGLLRAEHCGQFRNIDRSGVHALASIQIESFIPCVDGVIVRGVLSGTDYLEGDRIVAFNEEACVVGESLLFNNLIADANPGLINFSLHIPEVGDSLCICIHRASGHLDTFINLKKDMLKELLDEADRNHACAFDQPRYLSWFFGRRLTGSDSRAQAQIRLAYQPLFSIIVPLYKTPLNFFRDMADSVIAQTYSNWELILVNSTPDYDGLSDLVSEYVTADSRITATDLEGNLGITENTNVGIKMAKGDYLCFFDHDDVLEPNILFEYAHALNQNSDINLLYCDEDKLLPDGSLAHPTFKPDFSLDMARDNNYICHLLTIKRACLDRIDLSNSELDGAQDHAMVLKIAELGGTIHHVPKILYHWRISKNSTAGNSDSKPYATLAGIKAVQEHLDRCGIKATVVNSHNRAFRYSPIYDVPSSESCSLIVTTRGNSSVLSTLVSSINDTDFDDLEVVFVCSQEAEAAVKQSSSGLRCRYIVHALDDPFNISVWRNAGALAARGEQLVFIHDDIQALDSSWLKTLVGFSQREDVGVVGTMTCDLDGIVQQAGLSYVGESIVNLSQGIHRSSPGYIYMPLTVRDVSAVSGVCLAISREHFNRLGGFDESYLLDYSDVDICFKSSQAGLKVIYTPEACLYHMTCVDKSLDSKSRSHKHFEDKARLLHNWSERFSEGDPWFSVNFSRDPKRAALYKFDPFDYEAI